MGCLSHTCNQGTWPSTQACALTRSQTSDLSVCGMTPNPVSHTSWQKLGFFASHSPLGVTGSFASGYGYGHSF